MEDKTPEEIRELLRKQIIEDTAKEVTDTPIVEFIFSYWWLAQIAMIILKVIKVLSCPWRIIWLPLWAFLATLVLCMVIGVCLCAKRVSEFERSK